jgi:Glycosyl hydrolases family 2, sugar binding domain.
MPTRRQFLKASASVATATSVLSHSSLGASLARIAVDDNAAIDANRRRLSSGWEYFQGSLSGPWEVWHSDEVVPFAAVAMPHCLNAYDGCNPDVPAYRGPGRYRTHVPITNPYPNGRTLLHFEGAGQDTTIYVGDALVGKHSGGYDEFVFDITDAIASCRIQHLTPKRRRRLTEFL